MSLKEGAPLAVGREELIKARNGLRDAIVKMRGGHSSVVDDADEALAALDIAIGRAYMTATTATAQPSSLKEGETPLADLPSQDDLKRVLDAAKQHHDDDRRWRGADGPAYFESRMGIAENRRLLGEAITRLAALASVPPEEEK